MFVTTQFNFTEAPMSRGGEWSSSIWQAPDGVRSIAHHFRANAVNTHCVARRSSAFGNNQKSECSHMALIGVGAFIGCMTRIQSTTNASGYLLVYRPGDSVVRFYKVDDSGANFSAGLTQVVTPQADITVTVTQIANMRLESNGANHSVYFNGVLVGTWTDATYTGGQPGFWMYENSAKLAMFDKWSGGDLDTGATAETDLTLILAAESPLSDSSAWVTGPNDTDPIFTELGFAHSTIQDTGTTFSHVASRRNTPVMGGTEQFSRNDVCGTVGGAWVGAAVNIQSTTNGTCYFVLLFATGDVRLFRYNDPDPSGVLSSPYSDPTSADFHQLANTTVSAPSFPVKLEITHHSDGLRAFINDVNVLGPTTDPGTWGTALAAGSGQPGIAFFSNVNEAYIKQWTGGDNTANVYSYTGSGGLTAGGAAVTSPGTNPGNHYTYTPDGGSSTFGGAAVTSGTALGGGGGVLGEGFFTPASFNTGSIAAGTSAIFNIGISSKFVVLAKLKVVPSGSVIGYKLEIYKRATCQPADLQYKTTDNVIGNYYHPTDRAGNEMLEGFIIPYQDLDAVDQMHFKVTNQDSVARSYAVSFSYWDPNLGG